MTILDFENISQKLDAHRKSLEKIDLQVKDITSRVNESKSNLIQIKEQVDYVTRTLTCSADGQVQCQQCGELFDPIEVGNDMDDLCPDCIEELLHGQSFRDERDLNRGKMLEVEET